MHNMLWASTLVVGGSCHAVVTEIGMETQVGKIAGMISSSDTPRTPLQDKLAAAGKGNRLRRAFNMRAYFYYRYN